MRVCERVGAPRARSFGQRFRRHIPGEHLVGGIGQGSLPRPQRGVHGLKQRRGACWLARRLRAIAREIARVGEGVAGVQQGRCGHVLDLTSKMRASSSGTPRMSSAWRKTPCRQTNSSSGDRVGSPTGCGMRPEGRILIAPADCAMEVIAVSSTAGRPARSISFASVAPQRVPVPQVLVTIAAWTPSAINCLAISSPIAAAFGTVVPVPVVT